MHAAAHVLLVEDDVRLAALTQRYLESHGMRVVVATDGPAGLRELATTSFDVLLLDVQLPGLDGIRVCHRVREQSDVPIIMLTARGEEADRVLGLEAGADDYVPKPFSLRELAARVRAQVRRQRGEIGPRASVVVVGALTIDPARHCASVDGRELALTPNEMALLRALAERPGHVLSRERLLEVLHGTSDTAFDRSIDVHVSRVRTKLGEGPGVPAIRTIRGAGYRLERP